MSSWWPLLYLITVVLAALTDEIDHQKGAQTLFDLWHLIRDLTWIGIAVTFRYLELIWPWWSYLLLALAGKLLWEWTYATARRHRFHEYDNQFVMPLARYLWWLGFGKKERGL
ncbi:MAG: hypothetical protein GX421_12465 [Caldisericales bacterium]|nr:hypothetical protein [Caldisericales bacterium]